MLNVHKFGNRPIVTNELRGSRLKLDSKTVKNIGHCPGPSHYSLLAITNGGHHAHRAAKRRADEVPLRGGRVLKLVHEDVGIRQAHRSQDLRIQPQQVGCETVQHREGETRCGGGLPELLTPPLQSPCLFDRPNPRRGVRQRLAMHQPVHELLHRVVGPRVRVRPRVPVRNWRTLHPSPRRRRRDGGHSDLIPGIRPPFLRQSRHEPIHDPLREGVECQGVESVRAFAAPLLDALLKVFRRIPLE